MTRKSANRKPLRDQGGTVQVTMTLTRDVVRRLDELATAEGRTRSNMAGFLLSQAFSPDARTAG